MTRKTEDNSVLPRIAENQDPIFDNQGKVEILQKYKEEIRSQQERKGPDREISKEEVEAAVYPLRTGTAPGPDQQFAEFFKNAGENFIEAMVVMMNIIWKKGEIPTEWKNADVKFLRKPGKTSYYSTFSYRPISLTCIICKLMERVILERIVAYIEGHRLIDLNHEGFSKKSFNNKYPS
ncbi:unnamed protein product [Mytilus coruscus]|uniref:Reverse transcriptase domain-containing protein n=1 Tax=Mytilus coruscus TaxID=42192 RepID=A0A6J8CHP3_MYTCO|nr:unnamed protein product [Mytilus coruscus]